MKKWIIVLLLVCVAVPVMAQERSQMLVAKYNEFVAQEKNLEETLESTGNSIEQIKGMLQERQVADKEIAALQKEIEGLKVKEEPK